MKNNANYVVELKLLPNQNDLEVLHKRFAIGEKMYNHMVAHAVKQLKQMRLNKEYKRSLSLYLKEIDNSKKRAYSQELNLIRERFGLTEYQFHAYMKTQQQLYKKHIDANTAQKIASTVWKGVSACLFKSGKILHFKKYGQLTSLEGKKNTQGIRFKVKDKNLYWNGLQIPVKVRENDLFVSESLEKDIKYCRIIRKPFKTGYKYFLQLIIEGFPPPKRRSDGSFKQPFALPEGNVGLDIGPSTLAICGENIASLIVLAPQSTIYDQTIRRLSRKLERSRRQSNPNNYNANGTIIPGKKKWIKNHSYVKTLFEIKNLSRKKADYIKTTHNKTTNHLLTLGDTFYIETMRFSDLQKRSDETIINDNGGIKSKKRYGKSLGNHAPSKLVSILEQKLKYHKQTLYKVNTYTFKASQYHHDSQTFNKKPLSQRHVIIHGERVQRDLYSAFLLMNSHKNLESTNQHSCEETYNRFKTNHDECIYNIKNSSQKTATSFGI